MKYLITLCFWLYKIHISNGFYSFIFPLCAVANGKMEKCEGAITTTTTNLSKL